MPFAELGAPPETGTDPFVPGGLIDGRYLLLDQVAHDGSCSVWRARDEILRREVAVKRLAGHPARSPEQAARARDRAHQEGRVAARLHHPRLAAIFDLADVGDDVCLVMEYVDAPSLGGLVARRGPLDVKLVARVGAQIADGLAAAHAAGVLHRDVTPATILVDRDGSATLTDFGVARLAGDPLAGAPTTTATGLLTGTPHFMAPEVARGVPADCPADVYSLGAALFTALEGQPPVGDGLNALETLRRVAAGQHLPMHRAGPLAPVLARLLHLDPSKRPAASEVAALLRSATGTPAPERLSTGPRTLVEERPPSLSSAAPPPAPAGPAFPPVVLPTTATTAPQEAPMVARTPRPGAPNRARRRRLAVGSLLGAAGVAGVLGGVVAVSNSASSAPLADSAAAAPRVDAPVVPAPAPASAAPIVPPADPPPVLDIGPVAPPALVAQSESSGDDDSRPRHRSDHDGGHDKHDRGGRHRSDDSDSDSGSDSGSGSGSDHDKKSGDDSGGSSSGGSSSGHGKHSDSGSDDD